MTRTGAGVREASVKMIKFEGNTYQSAQVVPNLRNVRIQADGTGVCIQCIAVLVDLIVQDTDRAPECGIPSISVNCLLVRFVRLGVFGLRHVATAKQIPTLSVAIVYSDQQISVYRKKV